MILLLLLSIAVAVGCAAFAWRAHSEEGRRSVARVAALASAAGAEDEARRATKPVAVAALFAPPGPSPSRTWMMGAGLVVLIAALASLTFALRRPAAETTRPAVDQAAIELMSMRHVRHAGELVVSGLVHNPPGARALTRVDAMVLAFDRQGDFIASGKAPLDLATIGPGEESPFSVTLRDSDTVARYRVSFRTRDGVVRHIDQRTARLAAVQP